jgi:toxin secretion/phage lysis holin
MWLLGESSISLTEVYFKTKLISGFIGSIMVTFISCLFGIYDVWLSTLLTLMILDYITGIISGFICRNLDSKISFIGIARKLLMLLVVIGARKIDILLGTDLVKITFIGFYIGTESMSILENCGKAGIPIPINIRKSLSQLHSLTECFKSDEEGEKEHETI